MSLNREEVDGVENTQSSQIEFGNEAGVFDNTNSCFISIAVIPA